MTTRLKTLVCRCFTLPQIDLHCFVVQVHEPWPLLHLEACRSLQSIQFVAVFPDELGRIPVDLKNPEPWSRIIHVLPFLRSTDLTIVKFTLIILRHDSILPFTRPIIEARWPTLQNALLNLRTVKKVQFVAVDQNSIAVDRDTLHPSAGESTLPIPVQQRFTEAFPQLDQRGMLSFALDDTDFISRT